MKVRRNVARLIGAVLCAYLVVLQAVVGGLAMAGHSSGATDPFSVLCSNADLADGAGGQEKRAPLSCCTMGCVPAALTPDHEPVVSPFVYDPRPTPRRVLAETDAPPPSALAKRLKRPRGPPSIG